VVGYHRETHHFSEGKIHERSYRPATHPIHFAADSPRQNPSLRCMGGIFLYGKRTLKIS
jgi:hypothetical protein